MVALLRAFTVLIVLSASAVGQSHPLPAEMVASFGPDNTWAEQLYLPVGNQSAFIRARLSFRNSSSSTKCVDIDWFFQAPGALPRSSHESIDVSFKPTAIARRAGTSSTFYVVGWAERTGQVIVESWTVPSTYLLGAYTPQGGGPVVSSFSHPALLREVEWTSASESLEPIWDAACHPIANQLLLLPRGSPTRILGLDLGSRTLTELYSATTFAALAGDRNIVIGKNALAGMIAMTSRRKQWEHGAKVPPTDLYFILHDSNSDGVFEATSTAQVNALSGILPGEWDDRYAE